MTLYVNTHKTLEHKSCIYPVCTFCIYCMYIHRIWNKYANFIKITYKLFYMHIKYMWFIQYMWFIKYMCLYIKYMWFIPKV